MRFFGFALLASATILGACGGGEKAATSDTSTGATTPTVSPTTTPTGSGTKAPITGQTHEVKMVQTATGYEYQPKDITINQGDGIRWVLVSGPPHNVAFDPAVIPEAVRPQLMANMDEGSADLASPIMVTTGDTFTISFGNIPPGTYPYICTPHLAMGMTGTITVR